MAYQFGMSEQDAAPVEREQVYRKTKKAFEQDHGLNQENILNAAYAPNFYGKGSVSETAKQRLNNILAGPPEKKKKFQFGEQAKAEGLDYKRILAGEEP